MMTAPIPQGTEDGSPLLPATGTEVAAQRLCRRLLAIVEESSEEVFVVEPGTWRFQLVNRHARDALGYSGADFSRLALHDLCPGLNAARLGVLYQRLDGCAEVEIESALQRRNGSTYGVRLRFRQIDDAPPALMVLAHDITEHTRAEALLQQHTLYDPVTALPNRLLFHERLRRTLLSHGADVEGGAVMVVSIDNIAFVKDGIGHGAADELVREVGRRLSNAVRVRDTVARLGDTEFAILTIPLEHQQDAAHLAERILADLRRPVTLSGYQVVVPAVIGISTFPEDSREADVLLSNAHAALEGAREDAVINYRFFTAALNSLVKGRVAINSGLSGAMERREFSLVYQPRVDIATWQILGVEALLRWRHLDLGAVPPDEFVPVLERTGLIAEVGSWVLETACRQRRILKEAGHEHVRMAVNLSVRQIRREFLTTLAAVLANSGLTPADIELEITESVIVKDGQAAVGLLQEIAAMGVHLSMDDFGCGYSSLSHLRRLPLDTIKIDRSFIIDVASDDDDAEIVRAIISMGHALRHRVVAEGVETVQQLAALRRMGCDEIQGYLFSPPVTSEELLTLLANADESPL